MGMGLMSGVCLLGMGLLSGVVFNNGCRFNEWGCI